VDSFLPRGSNQESGEPGVQCVWEGTILMTREASGEQFEIKVDGLVRAHRDFRETAIEAARFLQQRLPASKIVITDMRDGSVVPFERPA